MRGVFLFSLLICSLSAISEQFDVPAHSPKLERFNKMVNDIGFGLIDDNLNPCDRPCDDGKSPPAITEEQCGNMMERILGHLNRMKEMHIDGTSQVQNTTFYALVCRTGANFDLNEDVRRGNMIKLHQEHTPSNNPIRNAGYRIDYYKNFQDAFTKLHLDGAAVFEKLCSLPFSANWDSKNFHERLEEIKQTFEEIASQKAASAVEIRKLADYFHPPPKEISEEDKTTLINNLLVNLNSAIERTNENDLKEREFYKKTFHIAADYNAHTYDRENRLEEYFKAEKKEGARSLAKSYVSLANEYKELLDKMGFYSVDVFQKAYELVFSSFFRRSVPEIKRKLIWDKINKLRNTPASRGLEYYQGGLKGTTTYRQVEIVNGVVVKNETQTIQH